LNIILDKIHINGMEQLTDVQKEFLINF